MVNKIASSCLTIAAISAAFIFFVPDVYADIPLPPELANMPQAGPPQPVPASAPAVSTAPTIPPPPPVAQTNVTNEQFQQWVQGKGPPPSEANATTATVMPPPLPRYYRGPHPPLTYEQNKRVMLDTAPLPTQPPSPDAQTAFDTMMQQNMPLSPQQVVKLRQQIDTSQRAAAIPAVIPPKPVSTTVMINLAPGTTPPAIRLAQGYVSSLVFVDSTGEPWPVSQFDVGNPKAVNLQWDGKSNIILIQAVSPYANGDMVVRLIGLPTPITLEIVSGQPVVDYRVDIHVPGIGPNTKELPLGTSLPNSANQLLLGVLDGVAPAGSKQLTVRGADAQAWLLGQTIYLRTRFTVLSPGWVGKMVSPDGTNAYELPRTSSVLISRYGEPAELKIEGL